MSAPVPTRDLPAGWPTATRLLAGAALLLAGLAAYHNSFTAPFVFDDLPGVVDNPTIRSLWPPGPALSPPVEGGGVTGRPLVNLSLAVNHALGGLDVRGYHATNLALHFLATLLLWGVLRRTFDLAASVSLPAGSGSAIRETRAADEFAFATTLLWTIHPLLTESVICTVQRNEVMGGLFYLLTLYGFIRSVTSTGARRWPALAVLACLLGMASKEIVATAPLLVLLYDRTFVAGSFRAAWQRRKSFFLALAVPWLLLAWLMTQTQQRNGTVGFGLGVSSWDYLLTQCRALVIYLKLSFWPDPLVFDYGRATVKRLANVLPQAVTVVALLAATGWALWRRPVAGFAGAWFFVILAPSSSIVPLTTQTIAEHRMYLPLAAVLALAVALGHRLIGRGVVGAAAVLAALLAVVTVHRNADYRDELVLWTDTVAKQPGNARAHATLGYYCAERNRHAEAIVHYREALRLKPGYADAHMDLGNELVIAGDLAEGLAHLEEAVRLGPASPLARRSLGYTLDLLGRTAEAIPHFERAVKEKPDFAEAELSWAIALTNLERLPEAIPHFERALALKPDSAGAHDTYGVALDRAGRTAEAAGHFQEAIRLEPRRAEAHLNLARALSRLGRTEESARHLRLAIELDPKLAPGG